MNWSFDYWAGSTKNSKDSSRGQGGPPFGVENRIYDLASLTKVIVTSSLLFSDWESSGKAQSIEKYKEQKLADFLPELRGSTLEGITLGQAWEHRSGLRAHTLLFGGRRKDFKPLAQRAKLRSHLATVLAGETLGKPEQTIYSDLGYILLCLYLEAKYGKSIFELWEDYRSCWNLRETDYFSYCPPAELRGQIVPAELRHPVGEVNDDNAAAMNKISSHAGLFGSVRDVVSWLFHMEQQFKRYPHWRAALLHAKDRFVCGWDTASRGEGVVSQAGKAKSDTVRGFLGWTGTAFWWDIASGQAGVLLTNRVFPAHTPESQAQIKELRHSFFTCLWQNERDDLGRLFQQA
jgi:CubicO group peptidase (beta-lactamase class C family)